MKTRLQSEVGFRAAGHFRGIYSGLGPAALASAPSAALFFCTYDAIKHELEKQLPSHYHFGAHVTAAGIGEVVACIIRVPMEVVKQRRQVQLYHSSIQVVRDTLRMEGLQGLYRGYLSTISREIPFALIQYPLWEGLKRWWSKTQGRYVDPWQSSLCGACAGGISAAATTPLDVVKTRIMLAESTSDIARGNVWYTMQQVYKQQGMRGLYAGVIPRTLWISIGGAVFFGMYEKTLDLLFTYNVFVRISSDRYP